MAGRLISPTDYRLGLSVLLEGDSHTALGQANAAGYRQTTAQGFFEVANSLLGHPFNIAANLGVAGESAEQIAMRLSAALAYKADVVCLLAGQNQSTDAGTGQPTLATVTAATVIAMCEAHKANGSVVVLSTVFLRTSGSETDAEITRKSTINRLLKQYVATTRGVYLVDLAFALTDPATGYMYADASADTLHMNARGAMIAGRCYADVLAKIAPPPVIYPATARDWTNYSANPTMNGDNASGTNGFAFPAASGISGTGPDACQIIRRNTATVVASKVARTGSWRRDSKARMEITAAANYDAGYFYFGGIGNTLSAGRYDLTWNASATRVLGERRLPTTPNGFIYLCVKPGTSSNTEPTWPTTEGGTVVDGGTAIWLCQKMPAAGDVFFAEADLEFSALTAGKGMGALLILELYTTTLQPQYATALNFPTNGTYGVGSDFAPPLLHLKTPDLVIPTLTEPVRYLHASVRVFLEAGGSVTVDISRAAIMRKS
ncbi:SGNH/GDSL hydrolase family protein [Brevundimonas subvibrioides]|uniref:SGNH hydrolase-type esterase domain-containing protein n=1 Tax=Brevundimonas subvibrioides (strain ATCC 15264 / DSM 4735 / LMG 14903 / NBRC 16000 / CB 81) TaxID=633149 RepID=D9QFZ8_BRESC|nr:GDSL-type esterase/lipase family protein [Brevundimonas subvibrioides]ADL00712.1 hypothetical protein Bresu_1400 [Brevundimonas subvibrioides ATCC 15264]